jgi:hypothetical protein
MYKSLGNCRAISLKIARCISIDTSVVTFHGRAAISNSSPAFARPVAQPLSDVVLTTESTGCDVTLRGNWLSRSNPYTKQIVFLVLSNQFLTAMSQVEKKPTRSNYALVFSVRTKPSVRCS